MNPETLLLGVAWYVAFLFSLTLHEAAHAWAALKLGDPTAYHGGQVTLDPLPHVRREPFGTVLVPLLSFAFAGWMMGWASAPYDPVWAHKYPKRAGLMALAGPIANLLLVGVSVAAIRIGLGTGYFQPPSQGSFGFAHIVSAPDGTIAVGVAAVVSILFSLNLLLFLFNLVPLPPLDGASVLQLFLPDDTARRLQAFLAQPMVALLGLVLAWRFFGEIFGPIFVVVLAFVYPPLG